MVALNMLCEVATLYTRNGFSIIMYVGAKSTDLHFLNCECTAMYFYQGVWSLKLPLPCFQ